MTDYKRLQENLCCFTRTPECVKLKAPGEVELGEKDLKPTTRGRNTKTPSSAPQAAAPRNTPRSRDLSQQPKAEGRKPESLSKGA